MDHKLKKILSQGYAAQVMGKGTLAEAYAEFTSNAVKDPAFVKLAKAECERFERISDSRNGRSGDVSAFVEQQHAKFLHAALENLTNTKDTPPNAA